MDWEQFYARFREPDFVPGFEIGNRLGGGAFGEVYKARKASIGKSYAIKFLKIDGEDQRDAAMRELEQVRHFAALDHPNLVSIEDLGEAAGGVPYLIMGYAGEDTLARRLKHGPLDEGAALHVFVQVCRGVQALHDRRLVHFDLKPSNVFLKGDDARVGDYGLSKMMADGRSTLSFGRGTPQYMAPEMLRNRADHRADIYSLGVVLYECLAGRLPYEAAVPGAFHVREEDLPPPFPPGFPERLRPVVTRCLRLAPEARYASVGDLLVALGEPARSGDSTRVPPIPDPTPAAARSGTGSTPRSDARQTAAELTRGAVEVARGVWEGLRPPATKDATPTPGGARGAGSTSAPGTPAAGATAAGSAGPSAPTPTPFVQRALAEVRGTADARPAVEEDSDVLVLHTLSESNAHRPPAPEAAATIPVPPAVGGGWLGTLWASCRLAVEVFLALARWLVTLLRRALSGSKDRARGLFARVVIGTFRLAVFATALAIFGALTTLLAYYLLRGRAEG